VDVRADCKHSVGAANPLWFDWLTTNGRAVRLRTGEFETRPYGDPCRIQPSLNVTGRILSAPRFNDGWIPAPYRVRGRLFAGMTEGYE